MLPIIEYYIKHKFKMKKVFVDIKKIKKNKKKKKKKKGWKKWFKSFFYKVDS